MYQNYLHVPLPDYTMKSLRLFAVLASMSLAACAADSSGSDNSIDDPGDPTPGEATDDVTSAKKFHYVPAGAEVFWKPGCGQRPPDGHICEMGLFITFTRSYADLKVTKSFSFDQPSNTLTVKLDTWSTSRIHPMIAVGPQTERLQATGVQMGMRFKVKVVDYKGKQLFADEIYAVPAP